MLRCGDAGEVDNRWQMIIDSRDVTNDIIKSSDAGTEPSTNTLRKINDAKSGADDNREAHHHMRAFFPESSQDSSSSHPDFQRDEDDESL